MELELPDAAATQRLGEDLGRVLPAGTILLLSGDLGSGKTTLIQGLGTGLGIVDPISSPTFTLVNEYLEGRVPLYHLDLYRLDGHEVNDLYLEAYWDEQETAPGIVAIEWAERLDNLPPQAVHLALTYADHGGRNVTLSTQNPSHRALLENLLSHGLLVDEV
ncbi:tRNA (adenosine(37)-N6)-threonylcarbamoyltransferase complex ATPase subunit type 1 TsaE [Leptolyngbya sp. BL0902]|uniref:tRNA (adenosine(37)-N6)-threonylcarbamoyltransferase complex ATPase subunit type 1 TsaE n=1 Tax=Leptolyngbya sp. BL0902 TaxID=1115757 RepID=UPI0018E8484E|nr:tRNA (adenosine(37)-N6)-threonylcarbamoyltransferase complex ATPase subunit type 1 TsaE [Leptolyngbya sp. BL0902]